MLNNNTISDPTAIAESFNDYFVNIGPKLAFEASREFQEEGLPNNCSHSFTITTSSFCFLEISIENVSMTKLESDIIAPSVTFILNLSFATSIYVDDWKRARVTPIYKSEDNRKCENYRPISILPIISKVFEGELFRQLYQYLSENSLLSRFQSGFPPRYSTLSALIQMYDEWLQNMDDGNLNCVVFLAV